MKAISAPSESLCREWFLSLIILFLSVDTSAVCSKSHMPIQPILGIPVLIYTSPLSINSILLILVSIIPSTFSALFPKILPMRELEDLLHLKSRLITIIFYFRVIRTNATNKQQGGGATPPRGRRPEHSVDDVIKSRRSFLNTFSFFYQLSLFCDWIFSEKMISEFFCQWNMIRTRY